MEDKIGVDLIKLSNKLGKVHVRINQSFLENLMKKASKNKKPHYDKNFISKLGMKINSKTKTCMTIYGWVKYNKTIPMDKLLRITKLANYSHTKVESNIINIKAGQHGGEISPKFPIKLDYKLGSIIGHILGDGSIDLKYNQVFYSNSDKNLLNEFESNMYQIFRVKPRIWMQRTSTFDGKTRWEKRLNSINELKEGRNCGLFYPTICGLILNTIFKNFARGKNKKITKTVLGANKEFKIGLIRAFYDDEGSVVKDIRLFQDRKDMLKEFIKLLDEFDINCSKIKSYIKKNKERYYFSIHRKGNFIKFQKEIGFTSKKKSHRLAKLAIIKNYKNSK